MRGLRSLWRRAFDIRPGEHRRVLFLGLYFAAIMVANNILKPVSWGLFLNRFDVSRLPYLYLLMAAAGGLLSYLYTKTAVVASLEAAVAAATGVCVAALLAFWALIDVGSTGLLYVFSVFVSLVGIVFLTQGWLLAGAFFDSREAKRLYGLLGLGAILGAAGGSSLTALAAASWGTGNLLPAAALFVALAYGSLKCAAMAARKAGSVRPAPPESEPARPFRFRDLTAALARYRHLQVIVGVIGVTFGVEVLVEFQFNALAKQTFSGDELTAFLGRFNALLSGVTFLLQAFLTTLVVARLGVGRTLAIAPLAVGTASLGVLAAPGLLTASFTRLGEAATRYSINRTAIELLYLPLPGDLKARTKAFVDVFMDRFGRGAAALMLLALIATGWAEPRRLSLVLVVLAAGWVILAWHARREYTDTLRRRIEARRLDLAEARFSVRDRETVRLLEQAARSPSPRQVIYALTVLGEAPGYELGPLLEEGVRHPAPAVRAKVYELARTANYPGLVSQALDEVRAGRLPAPELAAEAVAYLVTVSPDSESLAAELVETGDPVLAEAVLRAAAGKRRLLETLVTDEWLIARAQSDDPAVRASAALAMGLRGAPDATLLLELIDDPAESVAIAAIRAAGALRHAACLDRVIERLGDRRLRRAAIDALIGYGEAVCGILADRLLAETTPEPVRRQIPRALAGLVSQNAAEALERCLAVSHIDVRTAVVKALSKLRQKAPHLRFSPERITEEIRQEARSYYQLYASLERFRRSRPAGRATELLGRTLEGRLDQTLDRLFRLLGLQYPPGPIYSAYRAVVHRRSEELSSAIEYLDNVLDPRLKSILLPMLDGSPYLLDVGRDAFGIEVPDLESAIRQQIRLGDPWLVACAAAAAAELRLRSLRADLAAIAERPDERVAPVARQAAAALA
jgi:AAA family ATP:ADP antiporter